VAVDGAREGDREVGLPESRQRATGLPVGGRQLARVADVSASGQVRDAARAMGSSAFLAGSEVVNARGTGEISVGADDHRRALLEELDDSGLVELVEVNHGIRRRQGFTKSLLHRQL
jgi:hypothetical protein